MYSLFNNGKTASRNYQMKGDLSTVQVDKIQQSINLSKRREY